MTSPKRKEINELRVRHEHSRWAWMVDLNSLHPGGRSGERILDEILDQGYFLPVQVWQRDYYGWQL